MRGTKLTAWRIPPVWNEIRDGAAAAPGKSKVTAKQTHLIKAVQAALEAVYVDVRQGLLETVGVDSVVVIHESCASIALILPEGTDTEQVARAIDAENVEAWCDENGRVRVGISPWLSTKDVDQTVLSPVKVIHVLLGIHASDAAQPKTLKEKIFSSVAEIINIQKNS